MLSHGTLLPLFMRIATMAVMSIPMAPELTATLNKLCLLLFSSDSTVWIDGNVDRLSIPVS